MVKKLLFIIFMFYSSLYAQQQIELNDEAKVFFSEQIRGHYKSHIKKIEKLELLQKYKEAEDLANQFIQEYIIGSYMDNFSLKCIKSGKCYLDDYVKPMLLLSYASWSVPTNGEIEALNRVAKAYCKEIDFAILYWDNRKDARKNSRKFNSKVEILYVDELTNRYASTIKMLKHSFGIPTTFVIAGDKRLLDMQTNIQNPYNLNKKEAIENCKKSFEKHITTIREYENKTTY
ncbi:TlpA family protein disulfide reductase [Psychroflexus maritimus]|uniref:TlpA family protein disulfide reductase n=1 Tax=Psychroflexus maritimus TaxID=2714865 RepID=A0A967DYA6_9FLAO|nr:TlpA family protein disulfide reductase [Psychroflexus maritimus]NGZ88908.1 TlpA family protein disulfide reductase [Psychroflexus maritimus]